MSPIQSATSYSATTGWRAIPGRGARHYSARLVASATDHGLRFSIYQRAAAGEWQWTTIDRAQVRDAESRSLLNRYRRNACGGSDYVTAPTC